MHEYSIVQALVGRVLDEVEARGANRVHKIRVRIGELSGVEIELLREAYEVFRDGTVCAGAELEIRSVAAQWTCPECREPVRRGSILRCPRCGRPARLVKGDEIILERVEMEVA